MKHKKILVILGNPKPKSLSKAIAESYVKGARKGKHEVRFVELSKMKFNSNLEYGYDKRMKLEEDLVKIQKDILWAGHLVWVYPIWWGDMPAKLKGLIDRAILPGFAFKYVRKSILPKQFFKGKSARLILLRGSSRIFYFGSLAFPGMIMRRFVLNFCGVFPVRVTNFYSVEGLKKKRAEKFFKRVHSLGFRGK